MDILTGGKSALQVGIVGNMGHDTQFYLRIIG